MRCHVKGQLYSRSGHLWPAGTEEPRLQAGVERLVIRGGNRRGGRDRPAQGAHQLRGEHIAASLARNQHEASWLHEAGVSALSAAVWICRVISNARSSARFADSPLTTGVRCARTHCTKLCNSSFSGSPFAIGTGSRTIRLPPNRLTMVESLERSSFFNSELSSSSSRAMR